MASPEAMADYYAVGYPKKDDPSTWGGADSFNEAREDYEAAHEPPTPDPVPGPSSPGAGMAAARVGDICAHGGLITGPGALFVKIGGMAAVRAMPAMDQAACPMFDGPTPHATGTIKSGSNTVLIENFPAARVSDPIEPPTKCAKNKIAKGCDTVLIGDQGGGGGGGSGTLGSEAPAEAEPQPEPTYADTEPIQQPPGESEKKVEKGTHWIEIELVDEAEQPVVGERYLVRLPKGKEVTGGLDSRGQVRISGIKDAGACAIMFPNLDLAAWERWRAGPSAPPGSASAPALSSSASTSGASGPGGDSSRSARSAGSSPSGGPGGPSQSTSGAASEDSSPPESGFEEEGPVPPGPPQRGGTWRKILQGECISSLAKDTGHFWNTIWDHAANAELKRRRGDPNVLLPRDAVFVPVKRLKEETGNTDAHHKFKRKGEPGMLHIRITDGGQPRANEPYRVVVDGKREVSGTTDSDGFVHCHIPSDARCGEIIVGIEDDDDQLVHAFNLGDVSPVSSIQGIQQRLSNLGFGCTISGRMDDTTHAALKHFQSSFGLAETGEADEATRTKLLEEHGC